MTNMDGHHTNEDFEDIPSEPPTPESMGDMARVSALKDLLNEYGFPFTEEPGWETRSPGYHWYSGGPFGVMIHHTGTATYAAKSCYPKPDGNRTDGRVICNALVKIDGMIHLIAAGPANYSSGLNQKMLLDDYVTPKIRFHGPQSGALGAEWYGNRAWINIEVEHRGDASVMPEAQEQATIGLTAMICYLFDWDATAVVGHYDGRGTKIDPRWDGPWSTPNYSIAGIQDRVQEILDTGEAPVPPEGEAPNINETEVWARESWQKAYDYEGAHPSLINENTRPRDVVSKQELFVYFDRMRLTNN